MSQFEQLALRQDRFEAQDSGKMNCSQLAYEQLQKLAWQNTPDQSSSPALLAQKDYLLKDGALKKWEDTGDSYVDIALDLSPSMCEGTAGSFKRKLDEAKATIVEILSRMPDNAHLAVHVLGMDVENGQAVYKSDLNDSLSTKIDVNSHHGLLIPFDTYSRKEIALKILKLSVGGGTPLVHTMDEAAQYLASVGSNSDRKTLIMVSDGEPTDGNICDKADEIQSIHPKWELVMATFDITSDATRAKLNCFKEHPNRQIIGPNQIKELHAIGGTLPEQEPEEGQNSCYGKLVDPQTARHQSQPKDNSETSRNSKSNSNGESSGNSDYNGDTDYNGNTGYNGNTESNNRNSAHTDVRGQLINNSKDSTIEVETESGKDAKGGSK